MRIFTKDFLNNMDTIDEIETIHIDNLDLITSWYTLVKSDPYTEWDNLSNLQVYYNSVLHCYMDEIITNRAYLLYCMRIGGILGGQFGFSPKVVYKTIRFWTKWYKENYLDYEFEFSFNYFKNKI